MSPIPDERLRLIFTCCHPALAPEARVALTLRAARRADHGRGRARVPGLRGRDGAADRARQGEDPRRADRLRACRATPTCPARLGSVLATLYLIFNEGYAATAGDALVRRELCAEAIRLGARAVRADARRARGARPARADAAARLAPRRARGRGGRLVLLADQDRARWDARGDRRGLALIERALALRRQRRLRAAGGDRGRARPRRGGGTDWAADRRALRAPGALDRARSSRSTARSRWRWRAARRRAWRWPTSWPSALDGYHLLHATRADLLRRLGRRAEAAAAYERALALAANPVEREFLAAGCARSAAWILTTRMTDVCVAGITGWTGAAVARGVQEADDLRLVERDRRARAAATSTSPVHGRASATALEGVDVLVDYTSHEAAKRHALAAIERGMAVVIGSTGLTADDFAEIGAAAEAAGVERVAAGNFSLTAAMARPRRCSPRATCRRGRSSTTRARARPTCRAAPRASWPSGSATSHARPRPLDEIHGPREARGADVARHAGALGTAAELRRLHRGRVRAARRAAGDPPRRRRLARAVRGGHAARGPPRRSS